MEYTLPEFVLFNPKYRLLITLTLMKGSEWDYFSVSDVEFYSRSSKGYRLTMLLKNHDLKAVSYIQMSQISQKNHKNC